MSAYDPADGHNYRWLWLRHAVLRRPVIVLIVPLVVVYAAAVGVWRAVEEVIAQIGGSW